MLSNNLKRASTILSRRAIQGSIKRCLSSAAPAPVSADANVITIALKVKVNEPPAAPRGLPTRHSRHHVPVAAPVDSLDENGQKIIGSIPGTLFAYNSKNLHQSKIEEYEQALIACHPLQQKIEYLLRGYSSLLPGSLVDVAVTSSESKAKGDAANTQEIIQKMMQLLERMEQEGKVYVELRSKYRSQLARVSEQPGVADNENENENDNVVDEDTNNGAWKMNALIANYGAPPGPTVAMYDLILDAIAVSIPSSADPLSLLQTSRKLYLKALERYELDAKAGTDEWNPSSCPTPATFNAVIRAATIAADDEEVRDWAMENAFFAFDAMYHHAIVHRNSATYRYMLDMIGVHFPVGEMRGNIAAAMWEKALQDKVIDVALFESMKKVGGENHGELFDVWWKGTEKLFVKDVNGYGFPMVWGKNKKLRRFDKRFDTY